MEAGSRVASLVPVATDWLLALGLRDRLVGVTAACPAPEKPILVRGLEADIPALRAAAPSLLIAQSLCSVCSASETHARDALRALPDARALILDAARLDDVLDDARRIARATGVPERGDALVRTLRARIDAVRDAVANRLRPRVAILEWSDPWMRSGHWYPDVVDAAGGVEVLGQAGAKSAPTTLDDVRRARPHVVIVAPCSVELERAWPDAERLARELPDVRVVAMDGDVLSAGGPRLARATELLAHVLHPDAWPHDPMPGAWRVV